MSVLISLVAFIILLTLLILIHELGHYFAARMFGVDVEEFGFGLPPRVRRLFTIGKTMFSLNWIPFGGFVRLKGENEISLERRYAPGSFGSAGVIPRLLILSGGVLMNFILAFALLTFGFSVGRWVPTFYSSIDQLRAAADRGEISMKLGIYIQDVLPGSPAAKAGIVKDSVVEAVDGKAIESAEELLALQQGKTRVTYHLLEGESRTPKDVTVTLEGGKSGIAISPFASELSAPLRSVTQAMTIAARETKFMTVQTVKGIVTLFRTLLTQGKVPEGITGPVGIAVITHTSVQDGFMTYLRLVALLSLSLAVLNILPIPALDGGRIMFVLAESIVRRPLNQRVELMVNAIGYFVLIGLIFIITFNDVIHLF